MINSYVTQTIAVYKSATRYLPQQEILGDIVVVPEPITNTLLISATQHRFDEIMRLIIAVDSLPPHGPAAKARALERAGRVADAESILRNALSAGNDSAEVHGALGLLLYRMGRFRDAVPELGRAAQLAPESPEYSLKLAAAILADHRYSVALDFLNAVAGRFGTIAEYQYNLGLAYYGTRRYENAIAAFGKAIALDPKMDVAYFFTGNAWAGSGDPDKAVAFYRKAIEINPKSAGYYLALGKVLGLIGPERDPESAKWLRKGLALKPGDAALAKRAKNAARSPPLRM